MAQGMTPSKEQLQAAHSMGSKVHCDVVIDYKENKIEMAFSSRTPEGQTFIPNFMSNFGQTLCAQMRGFFGVGGSIVEKGKKK